jgi:two-component system, cell cycle sensor histidine kinase and response regulator CckA
MKTDAGDQGKSSGWLSRIVTRLSLSRRFSFLIPMTVTTLIVCAVISIYELLAHFLFAEQSSAKFHAVTIILLGSLAAILGAYFALRQYEQLRQHTVEEINLRKQAEDSQLKLVFRTRQLEQANQELVNQITERIETLQQLKDQERFLSGIFESIQDGICVVDRNFVIQAVNPTMERWYAHSTPLVGKKCYEAYHGASSPCEVCPTRETLSSGKTAYRVVPMTGPGKQTVGAMDLYSFPLLDSSTGQLKGVIEYVRDITDRKRLEEQLRQSHKMEAVGQLAGGIAHDFNNLLTCIAGFSELLDDQLPENSPLRKDVEQIQKASAQASALTRQLLAFSRRQVLQPKVLSLNVVITEMEKMLRRLIGEDIELVTELEPELSRVKVDRGQIEQVILNLIVNARDAMPNGGKLTIRTEMAVLEPHDVKVIHEARPGCFVCLSVTDTGIGMDRTTLERIFEPFFTTKEKGTGLGLATVYGIAKQHDGWINVYSQSNEGSTFTVYLPALLMGDEERNDGELAGRISGHGERILLVEDRDEVRDFARRALQAHGYTVLEAPDASEAFDVFVGAKREIDLLFTDMILPDESGLEFAERLLALKPDLKVLLSSGYTDEKSHRPAIQEKGFPFVQKPYSMSVLLHAAHLALHPSGRPAEEPAGEA